MSVPPSRARRSGLLAAAVLTTALVVPGAPAFGIAAGTPAAAGSYGFVAKIDIGTVTGGGRSCTGSLVDAQWVLTATDCFAEGTQPVAAGAPTRPTTATIGRVDLADTTAGQVRPVVALVPHAGRNVVLARLARPVDIAPVAIGTTAPTEGDVLRVAGYGRTATEWVPGRLHTATFDVTGVAGGLTTITGQAPGQASPCKGDAGGPALRETAGRVELVAVNHTSWQNGCLGVTETRQGAVETRVDDIADWIRQYVPGGPAADARADVTLAYAYADGALAPFTFTTGPTGAMSPRSGYKSAAGAYDGAKVRVARGDFNGDRIIDQAVLRGAPDGGFSLDTFLARADGSYLPPIRSWQAAKTWGSWDSLRLTSGDYDGDGRTDLAGLYDYADNSVALITWTARADGGFANPARSWFAPATPYWGDPGRTRIFSGDVNGDGRADVAAFYNYADHGIGLLTWLSKAGGAFNNPFHSWYAAPEPYWGELARMKTVAGDFNGDGRADVAALYGYANNNLALLTFTGKPDGGFNAPFASWRSTTTSWGSWGSTRLVSGDYNADGRDDLAALYGYADDGLSWNTFTAKPDGGFNTATRSWYAAPGTFGWFTSIRLAGE